MSPCPGGIREIILPWGETKMLNYKETLRMLKEYLEEGENITLIIIANGCCTGVGISININNLNKKISTRGVSKRLSKQLRLAWLATQ